MHKNQKIMAASFAVALLGLGVSCVKENDADMEKPVIENIADASPVNCEVFQRGGEIHFHYVFADNVGLGNFNIEIHNNFEHHTHSTEGGECDWLPDKDPVNPWVFNQDYAIPDAPLDYDAYLTIPIPEDIDTGDYHFMIRLTDTAGWQQIKSVSIRIIE